LLITETVNYGRIKFYKDSIFLLRRSLLLCQNYTFKNYFFSIQQWHYDYCRGSNYNETRKTSGYLENGNQDAGHNQRKRHEGDWSVGVGPLEAVLIGDIKLENDEGVRRRFGGRHLPIILIFLENFPTSLV
jgi:hypothetical protein